MFRFISKECEIYRVGEGVVLDVTDLTDVRGQFELLLGTLGSTVLGFYFNVRPGGLMIEVDSAVTLTAVTGTASLSTTAINCKGYSQCALRVKTASGGTADIGILSLTAYGATNPRSTKGKYIRLDATATSGSDSSDDGLGAEGGGAGGIFGVPPDSP